MDTNRKVEFSVLLPQSESKKISYAGIDDAYHHCGHDENGNNNKSNSNNRQQHRKDIQPWKTVAIVSIILLVGLILAVGIDPGGVVSSSSNPMQWKLRKNSPRCQFCDQSPPTLHHNKSYTIKNVSGIDNGNGNGNGNDNTDGSVIVVTPMTIAYDYELYDGQTIYTNSRAELIPNLDFDYAVLGISAARNINRETNEPVSLDEVYVHHVSFLPLNMIGAEVLTRDKSMPYMKFPDGYALHVVVKESPHIKTNAHLLSNKNLAPIGGSLSRAHKECNECFYAPGKGSDCTPEVSGTFKCCGDNYACTIGREECACATTKSTSTTHDKRDNNTPRTRTRTRTRTTTKYRIEMDLLISREIGKFKRVDQWNFAAPACAVNLNGDGVFEKYQPDNFCANKTSLAFGGGSLFQNVPENNANPYLKTKVNLLARSGGKLVWAQSHLHTGAINGTLLLNGRVVCTATTTHGTDSDETTNARNEQNHLVRIDSCYDEIGEDGIRFEEGDVFTAESFYYGGRDDERMSGIEAAGEHKNVMSMFFTGVDLDGDSEFLTEKRTSFNLWNNFVPVAGYLKRKRVASSKIHYNS